jgi:alkanesulfonate monooxygenase SsuD/methylene tetrahydromethanopterin reductase-like flavin-dependent oxidoreductase (luciferase family)
MQLWFHNENTYPFVEQSILDNADSVRASLPGRLVDPKLAADLFHQCMDESLLCDDLGINIVSIEHHAGINSLYGASPIILGALARQTRNVRVLSQGTLISLRKDPVRIAEEYATADVLLRGRLDIGFVKSGDSEMASSNANPVGNLERFWEAIDLIGKALKNVDGPTRWEGKHFAHRHINLWPRPYQQPHPPMWAATGDPDTSRELGRRNMVNSVVLRGIEGTQKAWTAYREARVEAGMPPPALDRFAYCGFVYVGDSDDEGVAVGSKLLWFLNTSMKSAPQFSKFLPGRMPPEAAPGVYRTKPRPGEAPVGRPGEALRTLTAEQAIQRQIMFAGKPETVVKQIMAAYDVLGGFGHLIFIGRSGFLTHVEAEKSLRLLAKEVMPALREQAATRNLEPVA